MAKTFELTSQNKIDLNAIMDLWNKDETTWTNKNDHLVNFKKLVDCVEGIEKTATNRHEKGLIRNVIHTHLRSLKHSKKIPTEYTDFRLAFMPKEKNRLKERLEGTAVSTQTNQRKRKRQKAPKSPTSQFKHGHFFYNAAGKEKLDSICGYLLEIISQNEKAERKIFNGITLISGAGISSTISGVPDFRSNEKGIFNQPGNDEDNIMHWWTLKGFQKDPLKLYGMLSSLLINSFQPSPIHKMIKAWMDKGAEVITLNIDDLQQKAGCKGMTMLHGSLLNDFSCMNCQEKYSKAEIAKRICSAGQQLNMSTITCSKKDCEGVIRPGITLYDDEGVDTRVIENTQKILQDSKCIITLGSSLRVATNQVSDIAEMIKAAVENGDAQFIIVNDQQTPLDTIANYTVKSLEQFTLHMNSITSATDEACDGCCECRQLKRARLNRWKPDSAQEAKNVMQRAQKACLKG